MLTVNMFEAKANLSRYVTSVAAREEPFVIILKNGKPVAKIVPFEANASQRIGLAEGLLPELPSLEDFNSVNMEEDFLGGGVL